MTGTEQLGTEQLTLYSAKVCPFAHRVEIALEETNLKYTRYEIDLSNKPEWYAPKINPASKVPAITYGGPIVPPDEPSPESHKVAESLVLLDFVADLSHSLLPKDPILRANARFFMNAVSTEFVPAYISVLFSGAPVEKFLTSLKPIQALLPAEGFAVGPEFTIADASIAPFLGRMEISLKNDLGPFEEGAALDVWKTFQTDGNYARLRKYLDDIKGRESFKRTFDEELLEKAMSARFAAARAQRNGSRAQA